MKLKIHVFAVSFVMVTPSPEPVLAIRIFQNSLFSRMYSRRTERSLPDGAGAFS